MDSKHVREDFSAAIDPRWKRYVAGAGELRPTGSSLRFVNENTTSDQYSNAQIDDYQGLPRRHFLWRPPMRMEVRARFSHPQGELRGTAGFGLWNDPFLMTRGGRLPTLPRALWFFYASPPSNMKLDVETPGHGWKVATIDALRPVSLLLGLVGLPAVVLMNVRPLYRALWPPIQRAINVGEAALDVPMTEWHTYVMEWGRDRTRFSVDGRAMLEAPSPRGPLGFVMWFDNQYMVATPWGRVGWGVLDAPGRQWMEVEWVQLTMEESR